MSPVTATAKRLSLGGTPTRKCEGQMSSDNISVHQV